MSTPFGGHPGDPEALRCDALGLYWCVREDPKLGLVLRLGTTNDCGELLPTPEEDFQARLEASRAENDAAHARIRELEAELTRRSKPARRT